MTWLEKHDRQLDAAALRRDVNEAQPTSLVCTAAIWAEMCRHPNPFAAPGNAF
jgi:hypothetical protein